MDRHQLISVPARLREPSFQEFVEGLHVLHPPILSRANFAQITSELDEARVAFDFLLFSPGKNLVDVLSTNIPRLRLSSGSVAGFLVSKLVKPFNVLCSWPRHRGGIDPLLFSQA
jgi:hypothetical protein